MTKIERIKEKCRFMTNMELDELLSMCGFDNSKELKLEYLRFLDDSGEWASVGSSILRPSEIWTQLWSEEPKEDDLFNYVEQRPEEWYANDTDPAIAEYYRVSDLELNLDDMIQNSKEMMELQD